MAVEVVQIRNVWCDICLMKTKEQTPGEENVATVVDGKKMKTIDLCEVHRKELRYDDIIEYGHYVEKPLNPASARGQRIRSTPRTVPVVVDEEDKSDKTLFTASGERRVGNLPLGQCSTCGQILAMRSEVHHTKAHKRRGEKPGKLTPLE